MKNNRRNNKNKPGGRSGRPIVRFIPLILLAVAVVAIVIYAIFPPPTLKEARITTPTPTAKVSGATIWIDNSASMEGYTHGRQYIDALSDLVSVYSGTSIRFTSDNSLVLNSGKELVDQLTSGQLKYSGQSLLNEDLKKIIASVSGKSNSGKIAFFVTDGIMCGPDQAVKKAKEEGRVWNLDHASELQNQITDDFKGKNVGAAVYRLISDFKGSYYCMDNEHKAIGTPRSFYIIAVGAPGVLADFKQKISDRQKDKLFSLRQTDEVDFIETDSVNQYMTINGGNKGFALIPIGKDGVAKYQYGKVKDAPINFYVDMANFANYAYTPQEIAKHTEVYIGGTRYDTKAVYDSLHNAIRSTIEWSEFGGGAEKEIEIKVPYFDASWTTSQQVNNDNDKFMIAGNPDASTFLFSRFIGGIRNGILGDASKFVIFRRTVTLKRD